MGHLFWLETKMALKSPAGILLVAFAAWISWIGLAPPTVMLEGFPLGIAVLLSSLGGLFRAMLLAVNAWSSLLFSLFMALLTTGSFFSALGHRNVLWSTRRGNSLCVEGIRLAAITSVGTFLISLGVGFALLNPTVRETMVPAGWQYIPIYLTFTWIRIAVWVGVTMFFFYLVRSRWAAIAIVVALQFASSVTVIVTGTRLSSLLDLLQRNLLSWNFVSPFAPLGIIPAVFFLQGLLVASLVIVLLGAAFWVQRRFPELRGSRGNMAKVIVVLGVLLAITTGGATIMALQSRVAPFTVTELWEGSAVFDQPYIWSRDFRLLFIPGKYAAIRLPIGYSLPVWAAKVIGSNELHRYEDVEGMIIESSEGRRISAPQSLLLIHPPRHPYPPEWEGMVQRFHRRIQPLWERAQIWQEQVGIIFAWPAEAFFRWKPFPTTAGLLIPIQFLTMARGDLCLWPFVWSLTAASGLDELTRCYLSMYLMKGIDAEEVRDVLAWLHEEAAGERMRELEQAMAQAGNREIVRMVCPGPTPLCRHIQLNPEAAKRVLDHWQQGEEMGHDNYIRRLLEGRN